MQRLRIRQGRPLHGSAVVDGDKSISHRAVLLGSLADGETRVRNFLPATDCLTSVTIVRALGAEVDIHSATELTIRGVGGAGWREPSAVLDCGTSGTTARLLAGLLAGQPFLSIMAGAPQLTRRPMRRVIDPLRQMGATILGRGGDSLLPLAIRGGGLRGIDYTLPVASAQVKSAILLAGLFAEGDTTVHEPEATRDHTERMLGAMGATVARDGKAVRVAPLAAPLRPLSLTVPGDVSSAAFPLAAAAIVPESDICLGNVGINPTRTGLLDVFGAMGLALDLGEADHAGEPVADISARYAPLKGAEIGGSLIPRLIDELPILAVAATQASGDTVVRDAAELRVKETDRIATTAAELRRLGAAIDETPDGFVVHGPTALRGAEVSSHGDHRLAMALAVAGLAASGETTVADTECISDSFPNFVAVLRALGADIEVLE
ncbi:MAG: 3-phosphoshikimate 1-carboxyvinyltransferase [Anaerolineae bacterium]